MYRVQKRKRKGPWLVLLLFAGAFAIGLGLGYGAIRLNLWKPTPQDITSQSSETTNTPTPAPTEPGVAASATTLAPEPKEQTRELYYVGVQNGSVCAFTVDKKGEKKFSHKMPIDLEALRPEDQKLLKEGVYLNSRQELLSFTEDFSS